jgi:RNA polymerase sigma factor (sigma-70 family)
VQHDEHLFRHEFGRLVTALTRIFGLRNVALAEDVVQDTFCRALEVWKLRGVPENPSAWLMKSAKNRAVDLLRRERATRTVVPQLSYNNVVDVEPIADDELRMIFSCCQPELSESTQIALTLNVYCGFTANEIAAVLLSKRAAIEKRIERGKKLLAASERLFDLTDEELPERLSAVQRVIYLLFNEGYHGASSKATIRTELCREAMRLGSVLLENELVATPSSFALGALMAFHAARLRARISASGELVALFDQDRSLWDPDLIARGVELLERAAIGSDASEYHLEAAIAAVHCASPTAEATDWAQIVWLYDLLMRVAPSPVVALNRAIAVSYRDGPEEGIAEIRAIAESERLASYPFYSAALGELEMRTGNMDEARRQFEAAAALARNAGERRFLQSRVSHSMAHVD